MEKVIVVNGKVVRVNLLGDKRQADSIEDLKMILRNGGYRGEGLDKLAEFLVLWSDEITNTLKPFSVL